MAFYFLCRSGSSCFSELNPNLIQIKILRNPVLIHRIHFPLNQRRQIIHHLFRHIISRIINIIRRHTLDRIGNIAYWKCLEFCSIRLIRKKIFLYTDYINDAGNNVTEKMSEVSDAVDSGGNEYGV